MEATYRALCTHGYANLTIDRIGREFSKSKSLLYHHYDGKDDLLVDFLEFLLERFESRVVFDESDDAYARLQSLFDKVLDPSLPVDARDFTSAMIELRAQAAHDEAYRAQFDRTDELFRARIEDIVSQGIESGTFREVDAEQVASFVHTLLDGVMLERVTAERPDVEHVRAELDGYVERRLLASSDDRTSTPD